MKHDPEDILQRVMALINDDITRIKDKIVEEGNLDSETAWTLCRYGDLLTRSIRSENAIDEKKSKRLSNLTTEELESKARELLKK